MSTAITTKPPSSFPSYLIKSSIGKKILMALSGVVAFGYAVGHMLGNLQIYLGQDAINEYAEFLHSLGALLWIIRAFLLASIVVHIWLGIQLKLENSAARPVTYRNEKTSKATLASRTMIWTGLIMLAFLVYHILHFTARTADPGLATLMDSQGRFDVYSMVIIGFQNYLLAGFYIVAVGLLCYHLSHGIASMFQSLGVNNPKWQARLEVCSTIFSLFLFLGYAAVPVGVMLKWVTLPGGGM